MSSTPRPVILYGDSLLLQGVRAALKRRPDVELHVLGPALERPLDLIRACCPAVFIFDLAAVSPDFQLALLQQPGLRLVGLEPRRTRLWSRPRGRRRPTSPQTCSTSFTGLESRAANPTIFDLDALAAGAYLCPVNSADPAAVAAAALVIGIDLETNRAVLWVEQHMEGLDHP